MAIIPTVRCRFMAASIAFYTKVLDFECVDGGGDDGDPSFTILMREGSPLFLSSHGGDGEFGQAIAISTDDVDALFRKFRTRGLATPGNPEAPQAVHEGPLDQTWGTREFYVDDPDGNTLRFTQGLWSSPCTMSPYLSFSGNCEAAFKFYEQCLGACVGTLFRYAGSPMEGQVPPEWQDKVMHASLTIDGRELMGGDVAPDKYEQPRGFSLSLQIKNASDAEGIFHALAEEGKVVMPLQKTFWAERFGMLVDRFGIPWLINCEESAPA